MKEKERPIVRPLPDHEWVYKQSRFDHIPTVQFRILVTGKSAGGKGVLTVNAVTDFWRGCFQRLYVFASTSGVDSTWKAVEHYAIRKLGQGKTRSPFMYDNFDEAALKSIIEAQKINIQRQKDDPDRKGPLKGCLIVIDDLSHDGALRRMQGGIMSELWTTARHFGASLWCKVHSINSLGSLARRQASAILIYPISNHREKESIREQFGQLARSLQKFDAIYNAAIGPNSESYSFLTIRADAKSADRTFTLRFESWLEPEDRVRANIFTKRCGTRVYIQLAIARS